MVSSPLLDQAPLNSGRSSSICRRLITLIFVDQDLSIAIIIVIRRELPRTRGAGPAVKACRIAGHEDSPLPCAIPAADHWCLCERHGVVSPLTSSGASLLLGLLVVLNFDANRPNKSQQLPRHCGHRMLLALAARCEAGVTLVQAVLRFPGQFAHLCATVPLAYLQGVAH